MNHIPLSEQLRPKTFDTFVGQKHLTERLQNFLISKRLPSILFFGPPGCGKSTLALLLSYTRSQNVLRVSASETSLQNLRRQISNIEILILDEIHRFSKTQQDFFLPLLESGELIVIATTTENPSFSITKQLLSRLHLFQLKQLSHADLKLIAQQGLKNLSMPMPEESIDILTKIVHGDARMLINLIEYLSTVPEKKRDPNDIKTNLPNILNKYDKNGDSHYEYISAIIKSIRGSDPDAALYYLACLLEAGEDPLFICRRLIVSAAEDIGLGDPQALTLAVACQHAVESIGMPEGRIPLSQTVVYLSLACKSNSTYLAYNNAIKEVRRHGAQPVPLHLRNASTSLQKEYGYGDGYKYPHNYPYSWVDQNYIPESISNQMFYFAKNQGKEVELNTWKKNIKKKHALQNNKKYEYE